MLWVGDLRLIPDPQGCGWMGEQEVRAVQGTLDLANIHTISGNSRWQFKYNHVNTGTRCLTGLDQQSEPQTCCDRDVSVPDLQLGVGSICNLANLTAGVGAATGSMRTPYNPNPHSLFGACTTVCGCTWKALRELSSRYSQCFSFRNAVFVYRRHPF